jgi:hypothetical protein
MRKRMTVRVRVRMLKTYLRSVLGLMGSHEFPLAVVSHQEYRKGGQSTILHEVYSRGDEVERKKGRIRNRR